MSGYRTVCHWRAIPDSCPAKPDDAYQPEPTVHVFDTLAEAERDGMRFGCLAGTTRIEVFSPDDTLQALWDKTSTVVLLSDPEWFDYDADGTGVGEPYYPDKSHVSNRWQRLGKESVVLGRVEAAKSLAQMRARARSR